MNGLVHSNKIEIRKSPIEGFGVFANQDIAANELLEEVPFILLPKYFLNGKLFECFVTSIGYESKDQYAENLRKNLGFKDPEKYIFSWEPSHANINEKQKISYVALPLGFAVIYNSSNSNNNASWQTCPNTFKYSAIKDIKVGEEILVFYGYFVDELGNTYSTDNTFNFGLELFKEIPTLAALKFQQQIPDEYQPIIKLIDAYGNLKIESVTALSDGATPVTKETGNCKTLKEIYEVLQAYKGCNGNKIKFQFSNFTNNRIDEIFVNRV